MKLRMPPIIEYWLPVLTAALLWLVGFIAGTGWAAAFDIYGKAKLITVLLFAVYLFSSGRYRYLPKSVFLLLCYMAICHVYYGFRFGADLTDYFWLFLLLPLMAQLDLSEGQMTIISLGYLLGSMVILIAASYTSILRGWDENSISMPAFFSYTVFAVSYGELRNWKKIGFFALITFFYFTMLYALNSRSSIMFSLALILCVFNIIPMRRWIRKRAFFLILLAPLIIAGVVVLTRNADWIGAVDRWSREIFHKSLYSGRDSIWQSGFQTWLQHPLFGNGSFGVRWHNSALSLLVGVGAVGYIIYLLVIAYILHKAGRHSDDYIVSGLTMAYLIIWLQQSLEIGLISTRGNTIPFAILGLLAARARTLERNNELQTIGNYPSL